MKFTKEEINLCKQIIELWKKPIHLGDWIVINFPHPRETVTLFDTNWEECPNRFPDVPSLYSCSTDEYYKEYFPLWQIQDALDWFTKKKYRYSIHAWELDEIYVSVMDDKKMICDDIKGKTPLEALLKVILGVLRKEGEK